MPQRVTRMTKMSISCTRPLRSCVADASQSPATTHGACLQHHRRQLCRRLRATTRCSRDLPWPPCPPGATTNAVCAQPHATASTARFGSRTTGVGVARARTSASANSPSVFLPNVSTTSLACMPSDGPGVPSRRLGPGRSGVTASPRSLGSVAVPTTESWCEHSESSSRRRPPALPSPVLPRRRGVRRSGDITLSRDGVRTTFRRRRRALPSSSLSSDASSPSATPRSSPSIPGSCTLRAALADPNGVALVIVGGVDATSAAEPYPTAEDASGEVPNPICGEPCPTPMPMPRLARPRLVALSALFVRRVSCVNCDAMTHSECRPPAAMAFTVTPCSPGTRAGDSTRVFRPAMPSCLWEFQPHPKTSCFASTGASSSSEPLDVSSESLGWSRFGTPDAAGGGRSVTANECR
mmetsp:Transcript_24639/g.85711  ORF Transcript_24639/g.85711 Transcript_24639/m.85711 type:complete len:410 (+) Transcript_24639:1629-2858(+)